jgi:hypothetical protein
MINTSRLEVVPFVDGTDPTEEPVAIPLFFLCKVILTIFAFRTIYRCLTPQQES